MSSRDKARKQVEALISKRVTESRRLKEEKTEKQTAEYAIYECQQRLEELTKLQEMGSSGTLRHLVRSIFYDLEVKLKKIDPMMQFHIRWSDPEEEGKLPRLEEVKIVWSEKFAADNSISREQNITLSEILLRYCV